MFCLYIWKKATGNGYSALTAEHTFLHRKDWDWSWTCLNDLLETRFWFCRTVMTQNPLNACFSGIFRPRMHIVSFLCLISNVWMCVLCHVLGTARSANAGCFAQQSDPDRQGLSVAVMSLSCSVRPRLCSAHTHTVGTHESLVKPVDWFGAGESPPN